ncbi:RNA polymerase sigma factor [Roseiconus nitratireducens]|uniref:RNA polymerase sigma factor n=1 Tax=Roseiconus nitratireducens TaxID=2605748 RepID=A0A5M6CWZ0_9BACT|nr:RNA polymerase sigma factor [Roseiconus nitratireducens]KAA5539747.1 RNA polymerase sigma factor [Roseiconus nitratireducens]
MDPNRQQPADSFVSPALVQSAAGGDRSAQREIYERTCDLVFRLLVRMVGRQEGEDLTQQVYVQAFTKLEQFQGTAKFETWLYRIARNEALQHLRRQRVRKTVPIEIEPTTRSEPTIEQKEIAERLQAALRQLDPELSTIISLKEDGGLSYKEIAEAAGIPEGTVGSRLNRARRELAKLLKAEDR